MNSIIKAMINEEEQFLVHKAVEIQMMELKVGKVKTYSFQEIKKSISSRNEPCRRESAHPPIHGGQKPSRPCPLLP